MASKKEERAFARGEVGVDGAAVEEEKDESQKELAKAQEALLRGRTWLGRECLTWLLWKSESTDAVLNVDDLPVNVVFNGKATLRAAAGDVTEIQVKGVTAPYAKLVKHAMAKGLLVHTAKIQLTWGEQVYDFTIDAEFFDIRSAKLPALLQEEEDDKLSERLELATRASKVADALVAAFVKERSGKSWSSKTVPALRKWMEEP
ncbi:MAG: hypothetical protein Q8N23_31590 [Archangium sp.]|nr:hypothetical protein [Archangium sp.]MDP3157258.1 hypothetical protein [Archangium sp.]MDP3576231.1 hypothetical protein [Archangium sp.]